MRSDIEARLTQFTNNARKEALGWNYKFHDFVRDFSEFAAIAKRHPLFAFSIITTIGSIVTSAFSPVEAMSAGANFDSMSSDRGSSNSLQLGADELTAMGLTADMSSGLSKIGPNVPEYAGKESGIIAENWGLPADNQIQNAWLIHNPIDSKSGTVQQIASDAAAVIRNSYPGLDVRGSDMHVLHLVGEKTDGDVDNLETSAVMIPYTIVTGTDGKPYMISVFDVQASANLTDNKLVGYGRGLPAIAVPIASEQVGGETRIGPRTLSTGEVNHLLVANETGLYFEGLDGQRIFVAGNVDAIGGHLASLVPVNLPRQEVTPTAVPDVALTATQVVDATPTEAVMTYATLPDLSAEGYAKSNLSTVLPNLAIYRDDKGVAQQVYDLETKQFMTPEAAGIHEVLLTDGTKWEMRYFSPNIPKGATPEEIERLQVQTLEQMLQYVVDDGVLWDGRSQSIDWSDPEWKTYSARLKLVPNMVYLGGWAMPFKNVPLEDRFEIGLKSVGNQSLLDYSRSDPSKECGIVFIDIPAEVVDMLMTQNPDKVQTPAKPALE